MTKYRVIRFPRPRSFKYRIERFDGQLWFTVGYASTRWGARREARKDFVERGGALVVKEFNL